MNNTANITVADINRNNWTGETVTITAEKFTFEETGASELTFFDKDVKWEISGITESGIDGGWFELTSASEPGWIHETLFMLDSEMTEANMIRLAVMWISNQI